jgi:tetratricopeptide (TPR) repeat protein/SAM-dependent methyltransferase
MTTIPETIQLALQQHQAGRLAEAETLYRQILQTEPNHADALHLLGVIAHQSGKHEIAVEYIARAIALNPAAAEYHNNIGEVYRALAKMSEAEASFQRALALNPASAEAMNNMGAVLQAQGKLEEAAAHYRQALAVQPANAEAHFNLGAALQQQGRQDEAVEYYLKALSLKPAHAAACYNLGNIHQVQGRTEKAMEYYLKAISLNPLYAEAHNNLGHALLEQGRQEEAIARFKLALECRRNFVEAQANLAVALRGKGRTADALGMLFDGLATNPTDVRLRHTLAETLRGVALRNVSERDRAILLSMCGDDNISMLDISATIVGVIKNASAFPLLLRAALAGDDPFASEAEESAAFTRERMLLTALPSMAICDAELESVLTNIRRHVLLRTVAGEGLAVGDDAVSFDFVCALVRQCFNTEYAFLIADDEVRRVEMLRTGLQAALNAPAVSPAGLERSLAISALYDSLPALPGRERLLQIPLSQWSEPFRSILQEQLISRQRLQEIAAGLTAITEIEDEVSRAVRRQYEENPFPLWVSRPHPQPMSVGTLVRRLRPGEKPLDYPGPVSILIAGCGTGQHPIQVAKTFTGCEVTAVDLSRASLAYAVRMAERFGVTNITFLQGDILKLGKLGRRFAVIECVGVLHHLRDPLEGWRVLVELLEQDGLLKIGLYSETARRSIQAAREFARVRAFPSTPEGIRECRRAILEQPDSYPARGVLACADFYSINGCRDLILHAQEHTFAVPRIVECLDRLGLRFLGFECEVEVLERFRALFPGGNAVTDLALWHRFEESYPNTFVRMYQFWCCKK